MVMIEQSLVTLCNSILGSSKPTARGNYSYNCPFCKHHKPKLEINFTTNKDKFNPWGCWVCLRKGKRLSTLFKQIGVSPEKFSELRSILNISTPYNSYEENQKIEVIELPKEYKPLTDFKPRNITEKHALFYLKQRGITEEDILKHKIGYCDEGKYAKRIIVPSLDENGKLNYFIARTFDKNNTFHYKNPVLSRNIIPFEYFINWDLPIILCEGVFDALSIKRNVIPLLGKNIQSNLMKKLIQSKVDKIYISLDKDAQKQALKHCEELMDEGKEIYLVELEDKDASILGFEKFTELIQTTQPLTFSKLMENKLNLV